MGIKKEPLDLLILEEVLKPVETALHVLDGISDELKIKSHSSVVYSGLYVLSIGQIEIAVVDTLVYILKRNPWKMNFDKFEFKREKLLGTELTRELLESRVNKLVHDWNYKGPVVLMKRFFAMSDLPEKRFESDTAIIKKLREKRNGILHKGKNEWVSREETCKAVDDVLRILNNIYKGLTTRYARFTRIAALRRLWSYLFNSPIMKFDDYWVIDAENDRIIGFKDTPLINQLATSERILLGLWRAEFASDSSLLSEFHMKSLDQRRRQDLVTLIAALRDLWLY